MFDFEDFMKWLREIRRDKIFLTRRRKEYKVYIIGKQINYDNQSSNGLITQPIGNALLIFDKYVNASPDKKHKLTYYNQHYNPPYTMAASYIIPLIESFEYIETLIENQQVPIKEDKLNKSEEQNQRIIRKYSSEELRKRIDAQQKKSGTRKTFSSQYVRSPYIVELAKRNAKGICQLCANQAPFKDKNDEPFLETHHIEWLSQGGEDSIENTVALCPNCHRKMHILNLHEDKNKLKTR
ncbi:MAG: HNH endonuclease [Nanoarchaeota archaeon]|nr:HNH endonuclease [Nanoarchaeota archaeon]